MGNKKKQNFYEWAHEHLSKLLIRMFRITIIGANQPDEGGLIAVSNHLRSSTSSSWLSRSKGRYDLWQRRSFLAFLCSAD